MVANETAVNATSQPGISVRVSTLGSESGSGSMGASVVVVITVDGGAVVVASETGGTVVVAAAGRVERGGAVVARCTGAAVVGGAGGNEGGGGGGGCSWAESGDEPNPASAKAAHTTTAGNEFATRWSVTSSPPRFLSTPSIEPDVGAERALGRPQSHL